MPAVGLEARAKMRIRRSEWLLIAYFVYTAVLAQFLPVPPSIRAVTAGLNAAVVAGIALLAWAESLRGSRLFSILRDWYAPPLMLLAYREMGWFAPTEHTYQLEQAWVVWDRALLNDWGVRAAIEVLGPLLPSVLEVAYLLTYAVAPFAMAMLYVYRRRERIDQFLIVFLIGILCAYALFPCFPSEPPRRAFPGDLFPSHDTVFRQANWVLLGGYGIHTSVFPSAHVAGAFAAAFAMRRLLPERRWVGWALLVLAVLIATATVYGRYHYAVDGLAGLALSVVAYWVGVGLERRRERSLVGD